MNLARGFGLSLLQLFFGILDLYTWIVIARALVSWVSPDPYNPIVRFLFLATEPLLRPLRRLLPPRMLGGIDLSPVLLILLLQFLKNFILFSLGFQPRWLY